MANIYRPEPLVGGDVGVWGLKELRQNRIAAGIITCTLYNDAGALKLTVGKIGFNNGTNIGVFEMDTIETISLVGLTASRWAQVEIVNTGTTPVISITSVAAGSVTRTLPTEFSTAYDHERCGYYIAGGTKRCIGMVWINAAGALEGIVNVTSDREKYYGWAMTDNALDRYYRFDNPGDLTFDESYLGKAYLLPENDRPSSSTLSGGTQTNFTDVDFSALVPAGVTALILIVGINLIGDGARDSAIVYLRANGSAETDTVRTWGIHSIYTNLSAGLNMEISSECTVLCDSSGIIEYKVSGAGMSTFIILRGWYLRES